MAHGSEHTALFTLCPSRQVDDASLGEVRVSWSRAAEVGGRPSATSVQGAEDPGSESEAISEAFRLIDVNGGGALTCADTINACRADSRVRLLLGLPETIRQEDGTLDAFERVFQRLDADDSKSIDLAEFQRVFAINAPPPVAVLVSAPTPPVSVRAPEFSVRWELPTEGRYGEALTLRLHVRNNSRSLRALRLSYADTEGFLFSGPKLFHFRLPPSFAHTHTVNLLPVKAGAVRLPMPSLHCVTSATEVHDATASHWLYVRPNNPQAVVQATIVSAAPAPPQQLS
jgi:hypothetical protein